MSWHASDATALPFASGSFDRVTTRYSFHHMPAPAAAFAEMVRVCRSDGRIVVIDATPSPEAQVAYDRMELLRDPSHTTALTLEQLRAIGRNAGLREIVLDGYRLEAELSMLADAADMPALMAMFDADIASGQDRIGVGARRGANSIEFHFPVSILAWEQAGVGR